jgi:hypothetical protein
MRRSEIGWATDQSKSAAALVLAAMLLAACASDADVGLEVLRLSPYWFLVGVVVLGVLFAWWSEVVDDLVMPWRHLLAMSGGLVVLAVWAAQITSGDESAFDTGPFFLFGAASYLTLLLISWRILFGSRRSSSFWLAHLSVLLIGVAPAIPMAAGLTDGWISFYAYLIYPGFYGVPTLIVLALLVIEVMDARRTERAKEGARPSRSAD